MVNENKHDKIVAKCNIALAGNRTPVFRVGGEISTTEPPVLRAPLL